MIQRTPALARGLTLLSLSLMIATAVFGILGGDTGATHSGDTSPVVDALFFFVPVSFSVVGLVLATRLPENAIGWLCLTIGVLWAAEGAGSQAAQWAGASGELETAGWLGLISSLWLPAVGLTATQLALRLPSGTLPSVRWRWFSRLCTATMVLAGVVVLTQPGRVADVIGTSNPIGSQSLQSAGPVFLLLALLVLGSIWSLVSRYRRAGGIERLQIRWIALGGVFLLAVVLVAFVPDQLGLVAKNSAPVAVEGVFYVAFTSIPAAIGIAVLRYRLYEIDRIVNRALVYGALTVTLAAAYVGGVLLLQLLLHPLTANSNLAIAGSTLAVAALFRPARTQIQGAVDHRFFRRRYDAARTLESFSARLRDQVDLAALDAELRGVVAETMQPAHVSLWLREPKASGG